MSSLLQNRAKWRRPVLRLVLLLTLLGLGVALYLWEAAHEPPHSRLALGATYDAMPADRSHRYIDLAADHANPRSGYYRGFYILGPHFDPRGPVVFLLTDGQMELVSPGGSLDFFNEQLPGVSYVVIGHRGHNPALFPEVYPDGKRDLRQAMRFYGSWQQVEDIEAVRRDMLAAKLLPPDGRVMLFGASGAGVLAQQYLARYGAYVSRAMLVTTGAPDLAQQHGYTYARRLSELDPSVARSLAAVAQRQGGTRPDLAYMVFQLARRGSPGLRDARALAEAERQGNPLPGIWTALHPATSWPLARAMMGIPAADASRVRMYELLGADLRNTPHRGYDIPLYVWSAAVLSDFLAQKIALPNLRLNRSAFTGEVLVVSGQSDAVFSPAIGKAIASAYPRGRFLIVRGGHRLELDRTYHQRLRRAFFRGGLDSPATAALLKAAPASGADIR